MRKAPKAGAFQGVYRSPLGVLQVRGSGRTFTSISLDDTESSHGRLPREVHNDLRAYFAGKRPKRVQWRAEGTAFQRKVWKALSRIGWGKTMTYRQLAETVGRPKAVRAVANAVGANPIAILLPCHRVVASDGSLGGYAYGVERKSWLLRHEKEN